MRTSRTDAGLSAFYSITEGVGLRSTLGMGQLGWKSPVTLQNVTTNLMYDNFYVSADFMPNSSFNPFRYGGCRNSDCSTRQRLTEHRTPDKKNISNIDIHYIVGGGCDYFLNEFWSVTVKGEYVMTNSSWYDGGPTGLSQGKALISFAQVWKSVIISSINRSSPRCWKQ